MRRKRRKRRGRRRRGSKLQCKLPQQCGRVVIVTKAIVFSPVNNEEEKEMEDKETEEENKHQGGGRDQNYNTVFRSNAAKLYSWAKATVSFQ